MSEHFSQRSDPLACRRRRIPDRRNHDRHHDHGRHFSRARVDQPRTRTAKTPCCCWLVTSTSISTISRPFRETLSRKSSRPEVPSEIFKGQLATLEWHEVLRAKVGTHSDVAGVNLFNEQGMLINSSEVWPVPDIRIADRAFFRAFKSGAATAPILVELVRGRSLGGLGNRHRQSGDRAEGRVSRGRYQGHCASRLRKILCVRGA